jgi:hypothetical protein
VTARDATADEGEGADGGIFACTETSRQSVAEQKDPVQGTIGVEKVRNRVAKCLGFRVLV